MEREPDDGLARAFAAVLDHYKGWPAVLTRLPNIDAATLGAHIERAWRAQAPKRLVAGCEAAKPSP